VRGDGPPGGGPAMPGPRGWMGPLGKGVGRPPVGAGSGLGFAVVGGAACEGGGCFGGCCGFGG